VSYRVSLRRTAQNQLDNIIGRDYQAVARAISDLAQVPRPKRVKKLGESGLWRRRIRAYRVVYAINDKEKQIIILRVAKRTEDTYKGL
jgi:mRNA interferase RelE/StbE